MIRPTLLSTLSLLLISSAFGQRQQEEAEDYYAKWLRDDVHYIITDEEKDIFSKLQTEEEKENFIEQFWRRRDTDPQTAFNEYKEEHYRRILFSNENFSSGIPGWKTDRGMIYIKYGPPDRRDQNPTGGHYRRLASEGGGSTDAYPFERWEYRYIEGIGEDIELEFVDQTLGGEYELTMNPDDKDALLTIPNAGMTEAEYYGFSKRVDRIVQKTSPMPGHERIFQGSLRAKDQPFEKLNLLSSLERAPTVDFDDLLRTQVSSSVRYGKLPIRLAVDHLPIDQQRYLVPISVSVSNKSLNYVESQNGLQSTLAVYGRVTDLGGQVVQIFEETVTSRPAVANLAENAELESLFQKSMELPAGRYKVELIVQDETSEKVGFQEKGVVLPEVGEGQLSISSVVLADRIEPRTDPSTPSAFGLAKVLPNIPRVFQPEQPLLVFFQLSGFGVDEASQGPDLVTSMEIQSQGQDVNSTELRIDASNGQNRDRFPVVYDFSLQGYPPGRYELVLEIQDRISNQNLSRRIPFKIATN